MGEIFASLMVVVIMIVGFGLAFASSEADEAKAMVEKAAAYQADQSGKESIAAGADYPPRVWGLQGFLSTAPARTGTSPTTRVVRQGAPANAPCLITTRLRCIKTHHISAGKWIPQREKIA